MGDVSTILASRKKKRDYAMPFQLPATDAADARTHDGAERRRREAGEEGEGEAEDAHSEEVKRFLGKSFESIPAIFRDVVSSPMPRHASSHGLTDPAMVSADVVQTLVSESMCVLDALLIPAMMEGEKK